jgi:hypothetical protein
MSDTGYKSPGSCSDNNANGGDTTWFAPANASASDNNYSTTNVGPALPLSQYLHANTFSMGVPTGSTIVGIQVEIERKVSIASGVIDDAVKLVKGGVVSTTNRSAGAAWSTSDTYDVFGGPTDLWGETWTAAQVNATNFGCVVACRHNAGSAPTASVDHIRIKIYYSGGGEEIVPDGTISDGGWVAQGAAATLWQCTDEGTTSPNGDTDYIVVFAAGDCELSMTNPVGAGPFTSMTLRVSAKKTTSGGVAVEVYISGVLQFSLTCTLTTAYQTFEKNWFGSWTASQISNVTVKVKDNVGMIDDARVSAIGIIVGTAMATDAPVKTNVIGKDESFLLREM